MSVMHLIVYESKYILSTLIVLSCMLKDFWFDIIWSTTLLWANIENQCILITLFCEFVLKEKINKEYKIN